MEGAKLSVCRECSSSGKLIRGPPSRAALPGGTGAAQKAREELEVVEGYGALISQARRRLGLPIEVLAERINEKLSFLERVEHERTLPDGKLCRKLEKELGIKLLSAVSETAAVPSGKGGGGMTLGDILEVQKKKKG